MRIALAIILSFLIQPEVQSQSYNYDSICRQVVQLSSIGKFSDATRLAEYYLPLFKADNNTNDSAYAAFLYYTSIAYGVQRKFRQAETTIIILEDLALHKYGSQDIKYYSALYFHYLICHRQLNFEKGIDYMFRCREILLYQLGNYKGKVVSFEASYDKEDIKFMLSGLLHSLGIFHGHINKFAEAKKYLAESRVYADDEYNITHDPQSHLYSTTNEGSFLLLLGEVEEAEHLYLDLEAWGRKVFSETHPLFGHILYHEGKFYAAIGDYPTAENKFLRAKKIFENTFQKNSLNYYSVIISLNRIYMKSGDSTKREAAIGLLRTIAGKLDTATIAEYTNSLFILAQYYINNGQLAKADSITRPLDLYYQNKNARYTYVFETYLSIKATLFTLKKDYRRADSIYSLILSVSENASSSLTRTHADYLLRKSLNFFSWGKIDSTRKYISQSTMTIRKILEKYFSFLSESQKQNYLQSSAFHYNNLLRLTSSLPEDTALSIMAYNYQLLLKGLLLKTSVITNRGKIEKDTAYNTMYADYVEIRKAIVIQSSKSPEERYQFDELQQEAEKLEKKLGKLSPEFIAEQFNPLTSADVAKHLKKGEAAIEFFQFQSSDSVYYGGLILRSGQATPMVVSLFEKRQLDSILKKTKGRNKEATMNLRYAKNSLLYQLIWQPLEKNLSGISKIYFAPSGILHKISFASLNINETKRVSDEYKLTQLNTTSSMVNSSSEYISGTDNIYLYGGVFYDGDSTALRQAAIHYKMKSLSSRSLPEDLDRGNIFQYLPGSKSEVENIDKMARQNNFATHLFTGWDATEESVKSLDGDNSPAILHIATHGYFSADPKTNPDKSIAREGRVFRLSENPLLRSGLAMAGANFGWNGKPIKGLEDGVLTAYEISNLYLPNTKLAVLSACETGLGDILGSEGVYGLQRAFKIAGVKHLIMSLWDVPDTETAEFMTLFYKNLFSGLTIDEAFRQTQSSMKNKYKTEPYKWAAWILVK